MPDRATPLQFERLSSVNRRNKGFEPLEFVNFHIKRALESLVRCKGIFPFELANLREQNTARGCERRRVKPQMSTEAQRASYTLEQAGLVEDIFKPYARGL